MGIKPVDLRAPFPYMGNKARFAEAVNERLGVTDVYAEPFAGSLGVLLNKRPSRREVVCDLNGMIVNFWRAMADDPEAVARAADWPTFHHDLTARHRYLVNWGRENVGRVCSDPRFYDAEMAGWWAWGASNWIGNDWCLLDGKRDDRSDRPSVGEFHTERGVARMGRRRDELGDSAPHARDIPAEGRGCRGDDPRDGIPWIDGTTPTRRGVRPGSVDAKPHDKVPYATNHETDRGVNLYDKRPDTNDHPSQRGVRDGIPAVKDGGNVRGVAAFSTKMARGSKTVPEAARDSAPFTSNFPREPLPRGDRLLDWFYRIQRRLERVIILNRDWTSAVTPTLLCDTPTNAGFTQAILLDPPYLTGQRSDNLYQSDKDGTSDAVAQAAYDWAVAHGAKYRIAYCCLVGDFDLPAGWTEIRSASGKGRKTEHLMFSPACVDVTVERQAALFEEAS